MFYSGFVLTIPLIKMFSVMVPWALRNRWATFLLLTNGGVISGLLMATYLLIHYAAPIYGINYFFVLQALRQWRKSNRAVTPFFAIAFLAWWLSPTKQLDPASWHIQRAGILAALREMGGHHLIMVTYGPRHSVRDEWVYNEADIDRAKVAWAREMDIVQNCKLVQYFNQRRIWSLELDEVPSIPKLKPYPINLCAVNFQHKSARGVVVSAGAHPATR